MQSSNTKYTLRINSPSTWLLAGLSGSVQLLDQLEGLTGGEVRLLLATEVNAGKDENTFSEGTTLKLSSVCHQDT